MHNIIIKYYSFEMTNCYNILDLNSNKIIELEKFEDKIVEIFGEEAINIRKEFIFENQKNMKLGIVKKNDKNSYFIEL